MYQQKKMCDCCKVNPAAFFYKQYINGQSSSIALCKACNEKMDVEENFNVFMSSLFNDPYTPEYVPERPKVCKCGCTEEDIIERGRFGCSECYKTFSNLVDVYVSKLGGRTYAGKMPQHVVSKNVQAPSLEDMIRDLTNKMNQAAKAQNYELAKRYQQEIFALKAKGGK